jgi:hypothetical protein
MIENLDLKCADLGARLAMKADEKTLTDALAVLEEQGVYALFLHLSASNRGRVSEACHKFLAAEPAAKPLLPRGNGDVLTLIRSDLATDLDALFLAKDLLHQALVYGRYHAKARAAERE